MAKVEEESFLGTSSSSPVYLTEIQFNELLNKIAPPTTNNKNFTRCTLRFAGERDYNKVEEFVTAVDIYKQIENISDEDALTGLPLLLKENASTWMGVKSGIKSWSHAIAAIRSAFGPKRQPYEIYMELFSDPQGYYEPIDTFLCRKRALLWMLPSKRHKEDEQIDLIYGLLKIDLRKEVARSDIATFSDLLKRARHLESLEKSNKSIITSKDTEKKPQAKQCLFCCRRGHTIDICRKRLAQISDTKRMSSTSTYDKPQLETGTPKPLIKCYGCGAPGVFRSNCNNCKSQESPAKPVSFFSTEVNFEDHIKIPTIQISIYGEQGYAFIDTAARISIAGNHLYNMMLKNGSTFREQVVAVGLADGTVKTKKLLFTTVDRHIIRHRLLGIGWNNFEFGTAYLGFC